VRVLVINPGSSSLKAAVIHEPGDVSPRRAERAWDSDVNRGRGRTDNLGELIGELVAEQGSVEAVGYRVVHGGSRYTEPTPVDSAVLSAIRTLDALAPLHNRVAGEVIEAAMRLLPDASHVACFDTAFHAALPEAAMRYPLPDRWHREWGVRRYGFHGLSVAWSVERAAELLDRPVAELNLVVAHLGSGCSVTAVAGGRSVDTSMGMTPLEGLMMGTRSGSVDPGMLLRLLAERRLTAEQMEDELAHRSGLLGVSGTSSSVRELEAAERAGDPRAALALEMFARRAAAWIGAMATALPRLDAVVFTGGIGERSHAMRVRICARLVVHGIGTPHDAPDEADRVVGGDRGPAVLRIGAREDLVIARQVAAIVGPERG
jgi:acetate kinase